MRLRGTEGQALRADRSHVAQTKEVMLCVHLILLLSIVQPSASTGWSPCSTSSTAWKARRTIRPTISRGRVRTPIASRSQSPAICIPAPTPHGHGLTDFLYQRDGEIIAFARPD